MPLLGSEIKYIPFLSELISKSMELDWYGIVKIFLPNKSIKHSSPWLGKPEIVTTDEVGLGNKLIAS
jgi:hypothetical protein